MIKLLTEKLCSCENNNNILWKSNNIEVYKKFSQYIPNDFVEQTIKIPIIKKEVVEQTIKIPIIKKEVVEQTIKIPIIKKEVVQQTIKIPIIKKEVVEQTIKIPIIKKEVVEQKIKKNTSTLFKPIEIILSETFTFNTNAQLVKQNIIDFISKQEFSKVFGMKKSAEIMSGIVNDKWNISTALFISFLFDKEVYYNNSKIIYNKEKNTGIISTLQ